MRWQVHFAAAPYYTHESVEQRGRGHDHIPQLWRARQLWHILGVEHGFLLRPDRRRFFMAHPFAAVGVQRPRARGAGLG